MITTGSTQSCSRCVLPAEQGDICAKLNAFAQLSLAHTHRNKMATPEAATGGEISDITTKPPTSKSLQAFKDCLSCRLICGGGLIVAGAYVYNGARTVMRQRGPTTIGIVAQITFAACVAGWGVIVMVDPVGKMQRADEK
ncbi:distal membrane-arm assembly complex protein 1 [Entelurus aequoreus]|uniref:distal membrane-arm assembly complex protein 1 n=1 Tax=Entelurus aequoreus TaxID=161455 RepID=UPI002B1DAF73|nr:distal membrane-arm assembly complex protein 1 [Entelurus aequoreus]